MLAVICPTANNQNMKPLFLFINLLFISILAQSQTERDTSTTVYITKAPEYSWGDDGLRMDLYRDIKDKFPVDLDCIPISFVVNKDGGVRGLILIPGLSEQCETQLQLNFSRLRSFKPAKNKTIPVNYRLNLCLNKY
jgi:hypothetical protein